MNQNDRLLEYISKGWDECIKENRFDDGTLIGLPYPYTVPAVGCFDEMYYWDTYFTNKGLALSNRISQAKYNTDNMLYLVDRYGFMPNGNRTFFLDRSQPPFLSVMVRDIYDFYRDKAWLAGAYTALEKEYSFWMTKRLTPDGLNNYDCTLEEENIEGYAEAFAVRVGFEPDCDKRNIARHFMVTAESGWDANPRWDIEGYNFAPVDLNSLVYLIEKNMQYFSLELNNGRESIWAERAEARRRLMIDCMADANGLFFDYNYITRSKSEIFSAAAFFPLFAGVAEQKHADALVKNLNRLEEKYGILTCEKNDVKGNYQWNYPNGWACLQYVAIIGLDRYGYKDEAKRVALKYTSLVEKVFSETDNLWEKYNVVEGNINVAGEYELPKMMGWSAGVYLAAKEYLKTAI